MNYSNCSKLKTFWLKKNWIRLRLPRKTRTGFVAPQMKWENGVRPTTMFKVLCKKENFDCIAVRSLEPKDTGAWVFISLQFWSIRLSSIIKTNPVQWKLPSQRMTYWRPDFANFSVKFVARAKPASDVFKHWWWSSLIVETFSLSNYRWNV